MGEDKDQALAGLKPKPFVFVLMPFAEKFDDIYKFGIKDAAKDAGAYAERVDEQHYAGSIIERIANQISRADVIVADMTDQNPNVFYEVGYAHALGKLVLLVTQRAADIPFDLKQYHHIVYEGKIQNLHDALVEKLQWALTTAAQSENGVERSRIPIALAIDTKPVASADGGGNDLTIITRQLARESKLTCHFRNASGGRLEEITHLYLFTEKRAVVVPADSVTLPIGPGMKVLHDLPNFLLSPNEVSDNLVRQYRLPVSVPAMPSGAIERCLIPVLIKAKQNFETKMKLRVHVGQQIVDFPFVFKALVE